MSDETKTSHVLAIDQHTDEIERHNNDVWTHVVDLAAELTQAKKDARQIASGRDQLLDELEEMTAERDAALLSLERMGSQNTQLRYALKAADSHRKAGEYTTKLSPAIIEALEKCGHLLEDSREKGLLSRYEHRDGALGYNVDRALTAWTDARAFEADQQRLLAAAAEKEASSDE